MDESREEWPEVEEVERTKLDDWYDEFEALMKLEGVTFSFVSPNMIRILKPGSKE